MIIRSSPPTHPHPGSPCGHRTLWIEIKPQFSFALREVLAGKTKKGTRNSNNRVLGSVCVLKYTPCQDHLTYNCYKTLMLAREYDFWAIREAIIISHASGFGSMTLMPNNGQKGSGKIGKKTVKTYCLGKTHRESKNQALGGPRARRLYCWRTRPLRKSGSHSPRTEGWGHEGVGWMLAAGSPAPPCRISCPPRVPSPRVEVERQAHPLPPLSKFCKDFIHLTLLN